METLKLKKSKMPQGKSVRVNIKLSEIALTSFDEIKKRKACKVNAEVFDYICDFAETDFFKKWEELIKKNEIIRHPIRPPIRKIFTLNEYTLAKLRNIGKTLEISLDELVDRSLVVISSLVSALQKDPEYNEYANESYVLNEIDEIWAKVSGLRYGLEQVFEQDYDPGDPENLNTWFANIEGALQELEDLVPKLFEQKAAKKT